MTIIVTGIKATQKNIDKLTNTLMKEMTPVLLGGGQFIRGEAIKSITQGSKSGRKYKKYNPTRTHIASAPGEAPASDTGNLVSNIMVERESENIVNVVSKAFYSMFLEFGTSKILPRPFMFPASEKAFPKIVEVVTKKVNETVRNFRK